MRDQLKRFFKQHRSMAYALLGVSIFLLIFVMPKVFLSLEPSGRQAFLVFFVLALLICTVLFSVSIKNDPPIEAKLQKFPRTYQQLIDEVTRCSQE